MLLPKNKIGYYVSVVILHDAFRNYSIILQFSTALQIMLHMGYHNQMLKVI